MPPPFAIVDMLSELMLALRTYFERHFPAASRPHVDCGWRKRAQQINQGGGRANRVVVLPGGPNGEGGNIVPVKKPGRRDIIGSDDKVEGRVRALRDWERIIGFSIWAADTTDLNDEELQSSAAIALFEHVMRAVHIERFATAVWSSVQWTLPKERTFGQELLVGMIVDVPLFAAPTETAYPSSAEIHKGPRPEEDDEP